jgi:hypothetical protein
MVKDVLVSSDIDIGAEVLRALDAAELDIKVALWAFLPEYEEWWLVLASRKPDSVGQLDGIGMVHRAVDTAEIPIRKVPHFRILGMRDPLIRDLRRIFGKTANVDGMKLGGQTLGGRFIEGAYIYRIR